MSWCADFGFRGAHSACTDTLGLNYDNTSIAGIGSWMIFMESNETYSEAGWYGMHCSAYVPAEFNGDRTKTFLLTFYDFNGTVIAAISAGLQSYADEWQSVNFGYSIDR